MKKAVIISCFDWYDKRLEAVCDVLIKKGYKVKILTSDYDHIRKQKITEKRNVYTYVKVPCYKKNVSLKRLISHLYFSKMIFKILSKNSPDLVYALLPPNSVAKSCIQYKNKNKCILFFDVIDMWPESMSIDRLCNTLPYKMWRNLRENYLNDADHIFLECDLYFKLLDKVKKDKCSVLHLYKNSVCDNTKEFLNRLQRYEKKQGKIILGYLGSINHIVDIKKICKIVEMLAAKFTVEVRIIGDGESRKLLINEIKKAGATVNYYGKIFDENKKMDILSKCDYALNLMRDSVKVGLTTKSIDYLSYGLPLINNIKGDTWKLVEEENIGINCDDDLEHILDYIDFEDVTLHMRAFEVYQKYFTRQVFQKMFLKAWM